MILPFDQEISMRLDMIIIELAGNISPVRLCWLRLVKRWDERRVPAWPEVPQR